MNSTKMARDNAKDALDNHEKYSPEYFELRIYYEELVSAYFEETRVANSISDMQSEKKQ